MLMNKHTFDNAENRILTVPNLLSFFRLLIIPLMIYQYCFKKQYMMTVILLTVSGLTDVVDGYIARRFQSVTRLGKILDPIADKATQLALLVCLVTRFPLVALPLTVLLIKELTVSIIHIITIHNTHTVQSARWHGKLCTVVVYIVIYLHIVWFAIPPLVSDILILSAPPFMLLSMILYSISGIQRLIYTKRKAKLFQPDNQ